MARLLRNRVHSTVAVALTTGAGTLTVATGEGARFPSPTGVDYFDVTLTKADDTAYEIVRCTSRTGDVLTIDREREGTTATAFDVGDLVELTLTADAIALHDREDSRVFDFVEDFPNTLTGTFLTSTVSGGSNTQIASEPGRPGIIRSATGTAATGRAAATSGANAVRFGSGEWRYKAWVRVPVLSTSAERFSVRIGFIDLATGDSADGAYFEYDESVSANWRCKTANNSTRTTVDSGVPVAANVWIKLEVWVNAAGTEVDFFINGTLVATITTNIPTSAGRETGWGWLILKSVGTTARHFDVDYQKVRHEPSPERG
jgi:hypothetical protein